MSPVRVNVGFDYGTTTTKVVARERGSDDVPHVLQLTRSHGDAAPFLCPSVVREIDGRLWFGDEALRRDGGTLLRSLKAELLPPSMEAVRASSAPSLIGTQLDVVVAAYLAWSFAQVRRLLDDRYGVGGYRLTLNVGSPMNHADAEVLRERFLHVVAAGWEATFGERPVTVEQGDNLQRIRPILAEWIRAPIPARDDRPYDVLPEAVSPIVAMRNDPNVDPGMFLIVDIGGTTTEAAVVHVTRTLQVTAYAAQSQRVGGDDLDRIEADRQAGVIDLAHHFLRLAKDKVRTVMLTTWDHGYRKEARNSSLAGAWRQTRVRLIGGGGFRAEFRDIIASCSPWNLRYPGDATSLDVGWYASQPLRRAVTAGYPKHQTMAPLLVIADGLSYHRAIWPSWIPPHAVGEFPVESDVDEPRDPTWYQDRQ